VDPKGTEVNSHRYIVAAQEPDIRAMMRSIPGVPLIYITRSVVILEPMAEVSKNTRERAERGKFSEGIKRIAKRKREEQEDTGVDEEVHAPVRQDQEDPQVRKKRKRTKGPKGPNPLSVKKPKKRDSR